MFMPGHWTKNSAKRLVIGLMLDDSLDTNDGVQQYVLSIGQWFNEQGHEVHYICGQTNKRRLNNLHDISKNIRLKFNGNSLSVPLTVSSRKLSDELGKIDFDVFHIQMPYSPFFGGRLIERAAKDTAVIGTFHVAPYNRIANIGGRLLGYLSSKTIGRFDQVIAVSQPAAAMCRDIYKIDPVVVGNAFNFQKFASATKKTEPKILNLLFFGRLVKRKGCLDLLKAIQQLESGSDELPPYLLTIAGDGPLRDRLEKYVYRHNLTDKIKFAGYIDEAAKAGYFKAADIAIFPSYSGESFGIVLLEAMANGNSAVIAADNPGYQALLKDVNPDALFKAGDIAELANKLSGLMSDPVRRRSLARSGRTIAESFDVSVIGPKLVEYYIAALHKRLS